MYETVLDAPAAVFVGVGLLAVGSLVRFRQWTFLIAGYEDLVAVPKAVAATIVGNFLLRVAIVTLAFGYLSMDSQPASWVGPAIGLLVVLDTGRFVYLFNTYERTNATESTV